MMKESIRRIIKESLDKEMITVGDIFSVDGDVRSKIKTLILVTNIIQDGEPRILSSETMWGRRNYQSQGYSLKYMVSEDNGETWKYEAGEGHYIDTGWIDELVKDGHWRLLQKGGNEVSDFFDSLNESDDLEWAQDVVDTDPHYRPDGKKPFIGDKVRILCKNCEWMVGYETCFQNPFDIVGTVTEIHKAWINIETFCETDFDGKISLLVPFAYGPYIRQLADMDAFGIKILPYVD